MPEAILCPHLDKTSHPAALGCARLSLTHEVTMHLTGKTALCGLEITWQSKDRHG